MKRCRLRQTKQKPKQQQRGKGGWEFHFSNVFPAGPPKIGGPEVYDLDCNNHQDKLMKRAGAILAFCGDFGIKIVCRLFKQEPPQLFHNDHAGEKVLCVRWGNVVPDLLAYGSDKGVVRILQVENNIFEISQAFEVDDAQVVSLSWDSTDAYLLASLSNDKILVIHRKSRKRWTVFEPVAISDRPSVRTILACSAEPLSPFVLVAPSYSATLELWSRIKEKIPLSAEAKVKWQKISSRDTELVVTTMCAFLYEKRDLIATAGGNGTVNVWQINCKDRINEPERASLVQLFQFTLSGAGDSDIVGITWTRRSLAVSCSDGFIYHIKVHRLPGKKVGELSYFRYEEACKLDQDTDYATTCIEFDPKISVGVYLATGGAHGFIYIWNLHTIPYPLAMEVRDLDWEVDYYSIENALDAGGIVVDDTPAAAEASGGDAQSNASASEGDGGSSIDNTANLNSILQGIRDVLLPEYDNMDQSLTDAKERWTEALNRLKVLQANPNCSISELTGALKDIEKVRNDLENAVVKAKLAFEGISRSHGTCLFRVSRLLSPVCV